MILRSDQGETDRSIMSDPVNFQEQIKLLVELQGLDTHIFKLDDDLAAIPETIRALEEAHKAKSENLKKLEDGVKSLLVKRKDKENELESKEGTIKKYQSQMYQVKTNKEYTALQEEIGRIRADDSIIEEEIIKILDSVDAENKKIAEEKEFLKAEEANLGAEKKKLAEESGNIKKELEVLGAQRKDLASKVEKSILAKYDRIIKKGDGLAVVQVSGDSCQGCFRIMPPQVINEIRMNAGLVLCENCARILYIAE